MKDVIIIGTGAAGMTAAIYSQRYNLDTLLIGESRGGTAIEAFQIENYPGFENISGLDLMEKFRAHAESLGVEILDTLVESLVRDESGKFFTVKTMDGQEKQGKTVVLALGTKRRKLGVPGEVELNGKGVAYCATCDGAFFKDKTVAVVGGGNSATMSAVLLTQYCPKVYMIVRGDKLKGEPIWIQRVNENDKIEKIFGTNVTKINGENKLESVTLDNPYQGKDELALDGLFVEIGAEPSVGIVKDIGLKLNEGRRIIVDCEQKTNVAGVFAAGDVTDKTGHFEQIVNSASQGARAAYSAFQYLEDKS